MKVFSEYCLPIIVPSVLLKLFNDPPFVDEFLFPASKVLLVPGDVVDADPRGPAPSSVDRI